MRNVRPARARGCDRDSERRQRDPRRDGGGAACGEGLRHRVRAYTACLMERGENSAKQDQIVDKLQHLAERFNQELKVFNARSGSQDQRLRAQSVEALSFALKALYFLPRRS